MKSVRQIVFVFVTTAAAQSVAQDEVRLRRLPDLLLPTSPQAAPQVKNTPVNSLKAWRAQDSPNLVNSYAQRGLFDSFCLPTASIIEPIYLPIAAPINPSILSSKTLQRSIFSNPSNNVTAQKGKFAQRGLFNALQPSIPQSGLNDIQKSPNFVQRMLLDWLLPSRAAPHNVVNDVQQNAKVTQRGLFDTQLPPTTEGSSSDNKSFAQSNPFPGQLRSLAGAQPKIAQRGLFDWFLHSKAPESTILNNLSNGDNSIISVQQKANVTQRGLFDVLEKSTAQSPIDGQSNLESNSHFIPRALGDWINNLFNYSTSSQNKVGLLQRKESNANINSPSEPFQK